MRVVIRVDATPAIGIGHLMRCLTLADALKADGADVTFFTAPLAAEWARMVDTRGHALSEHAETGGADWLVVDHYGLDAQWERAMAPGAGHVLVIDDLADRDHDCDILLDQNYLPNRARDYQSRVPSQCRLLMGPEFALVRPEYAEARAQSRPREKGHVNRVLVFFGGADAARLTERAFDALSQPGCEDLEVDIVTGADAPRREALEQLANRRGRTRVFGPRPHLADLMVEADVALGAGGSTSWERLCLGLPGVIVTVAANQEHVADAMSADNLIVLLNTAETVTAGQMTDAIVRMRRGEGWPDVARGMEICDGGGAGRVAAVMRRMSAGTETAA